MRALLKDAPERSPTGEPTKQMAKMKAAGAVWSSLSEAEKDTWDVATSADVAPFPKRSRGLGAPDAPELDKHPKRRRDYRGTSLIRNRPPLGPYSSICLGPYGGPRGGGGFL